MFSIVYWLVTGATIFFGGKFAKETIKRLKEEGYHYPFKDKELKEKIFEILPLVLLVFLPLLHILTLAGGILAFKNEDNKDLFYDKLKEALEKAGVIYKEETTGYTRNVTATKVKEIDDEEEEVIKTNADAYAMYAREFEKHECPTLNIPTLEVPTEEEKGYQKSIGSRK
jgi:hypothetical protein